MLKNYVNVALRNLRRHPGYAFINIFGVALGMGCCLLIGLYVRYEQSYDRFHANADRIYRLVDHVSGEDFERDYAAVPAPMGPALVHEHPDVEAAVRFFTWEAPWVQYGQQRFKENGVFFADSSVFDVFTFPLVAGDPATALQQPYTLVLSESMAAKYFGDEPAIGKVLTLDLDSEFTVTGVMRDVPPNAHFIPEILASFSTLGTDFGTQSWLRHDFYTYLLLRDPQASSSLAARLPDFIDRHMRDTLEEEGVTLTPALQPLTAIHLHSHRFEEIAPNGNAATLQMLIIVGLFILIIACVNFTNLATARSMQRAREVGMRKVLGGVRRQVALQFLGESVFSSLLALVLALALVWLVLPVLNDITGAALALHVTSSMTLVAGLAGLALVVGVLAGLYPALYLSGLKPLSVLQGRARTRQGHTGWIRQSLIVVQFTVAIALLICTGLILGQLDYLEQKDLGFDREQVAVIRLYDEQRSDYAMLREELRQHAGVRAVSRTSGVPGMDAGIGGVSVLPEGGTAERAVRMMWVDYDFPEAFGIDMVAGRSFSEDYPTDAEAAFVINETAARELGWESPEQAIGKRLRWPDQKEGTVVGVMKDFHVVSLHQRIDPMVVHIWPQWTNFVAVRLAAAPLPETLDFIRSRWEARNPDAPFDAFFADQAFDRMYRAEQRFGQLFGYFAGLAMLIACLGLFGLAALATQQRTKEIGVRKVHGARVAGLVTLLSKDFLRLVVIAFVVAAPLAYLAMQHWLATFAYRVAVTPRPFLAMGALAFTVALVAIGYHTLRAASANPVDALRYE